MTVAGFLHHAGHLFALALVGGGAAAVGGAEQFAGEFHGAFREGVAIDRLAFDGVEVGLDGGCC